MDEKKRFYGSPVIVRDDNGQIYKIIELALKPYKEFTFLVLSNQSQNFEKVYSFVGPNTVLAISVPKALKELHVSYYNRKSELLQEFEYNLLEGDKFREDFDPNLVRYARIKKYVEDNMDRIEGTAEEKEVHTAQIHACSYSPTAKQYVMTRIQNLVAQNEDVKAYEVHELTDKIFSECYGLGPLQELDEDPEVGEIMVNARTFPRWECQVYYVKDQIKRRYDKEFEDVNQLTNILNRIIAFDRKSINSVNNSIVEAIRPNGDRVNIVVPNASDNYSLNIRKFTNFIPDMAGMRKAGTVTEPIENLLRVLVRGKANIGIGGMMGTGKTTLINYLLTYTPRDERKTIIAAVAETDIDRVLKGHDVLVFKVDEEKDITFTKLLRTSLRTTSDRVIIPESRGSEFKELYEANVKTKGNMFTAHATDDESFMDVCVDMYMSSPDAAQESAKYIKDKICKAIDIVVIMVRVGNKIRIKSISEVCMEHGEYSHMSPLMLWTFDKEDASNGHYEFTGTPMSPALCNRLNEMGVAYSEIEKVNKMLINKGV